MTVFSMAESGWSHPMSRSLPTEGMRLKRGSLRGSFTLVELLISISIVATLSAAALFTLYGVQEHARIARTKSLVARINVEIMERWETFLTRPVPVRILPGDNLTAAAGRRLSGIRELMRMHLPDRKSDLVDDPTFLRRPGTGPPTPLLVSQFLSYRRKADRMVKAANGTSLSFLNNTK